MVLCWDMPSFHSIRAALAALGVAVPLAVAAQPPPVPPAPAGGASTFTVFLRGAPIGAEQIALTRSATGWSILGSGRVGAPFDIIARRIEVRYTADWRPLELSLDATVRGGAQMVHTVVDGSTARTDVTIDGKVTQKTDTIDPGAALVLPTTFFAPYAAIAAQLRNAAPGTELPVYTAPVSAFVVRVGESSPQQIQTAARVISARRMRVTLMTPGVPIDADIWTDDSGRMIRLSVPAQSLEVVREDIAAVSSRSVAISRPNDEPLNIPSNGSFSATLYENASGQPGKVISDFGIGPVQEFRTGETLVGYPEFQYLAPLNQPFVAQAGVRYWLSIVQPPDYSWGWEGASPPGVSFYSIQGGAWQSADYDASFALSTDIPEPSCFSLLLCAGFAAAAYAGRHHLGRPIRG